MMAKHFSTHSACFQWPVAVWNNMLDIARINRFIIFGTARGGKPSRMQFLIHLAEQLIFEHKERRSRRRTESLVSLRDLDTGIRNQRRKYQAASGCKNMTVTICQRCCQPTCGRCAVENRVTICTKQNICTCKDC